MGLGLLLALGGSAAKDGTKLKKHRGKELQRLMGDAKCIKAKQAWRRGLGAFAQERWAWRGAVSCLGRSGLQRPQQLTLSASIMKEGKVKKARQKDSPVIAKPQSGVCSTVKLLPGARPLAKTPAARSLLKPLKKLEPRLSGASGLPKPAPSLLQCYAARRKR